MSKKEIIAYAITHAPPGVKGGPYDGCGMAGDKTPSLALAQRYGDTGTAREDAAWLVRRGHDARVIRIVRKGPRRLCDACGFLIEAESRRRAPSEASAVDVLRSFIAWVDCDDGEEETPLRPIEDAARAVLAASGPDPTQVVRAAMAWSEANVANGAAQTAALQLACVAYRKAGGK